MLGILLVFILVIAFLSSIGVTSDSRAEQKGFFDQLAEASEEEELLRRQQEEDEWNQKLNDRNKY